MAHKQHSSVADIGDIPFFPLSNYVAPGVLPQTTQQIHHFFSHVAPALAENAVNPNISDFLTTLFGKLSVYIGLYGTFTPIILPKSLLSDFLNILNLLQFQREISMDIPQDTYFHRNKPYYTLINTKKSTEKHRDLYIVTPLVNYITATPITTTPLHAQQTNITLQEFIDIKPVWDITTLFTQILINHHITNLPLAVNEWPYQLPINLEEECCYLLDLELFDIPYPYLLVYINTKNIYTNETITELFDALSGLKSVETLLTKHDFILGLNNVLMELTSPYSYISAWLFHNLIETFKTDTHEIVNAGMLLLDKIKEMLLYKYPEETRRVSPLTTTVYNISLRVESASANYIYQKLLDNKIATYSYIKDDKDSYIVFNWSPALEMTAQNSDETKHLLDTLNYIL